MLPQEVIRKKREGGTLSQDEIEFIVSGMADGSVTEGQLAAFAMAVFFKGMTLDERVALTLAMRNSGAVLNWSHLNGPALDKHSTGGVGDNVSLILAPVVAACGGYVPMISGRGLGHTGGTLDKFDSIPGYQTQPDNALFCSVVHNVGCAIIGQTMDLAPADKRLYGIRDVTATVESIDLITASILSKKLAVGPKALVLDVKVGSGAFMETAAEALSLSESLVHVANGSNVCASALITDMNQPLASAAGNAVEVRNAVDLLTGDKIDKRVRNVALDLSAELLVLGGVESDIRKARTATEDALSSGRAADRFERMVAALGGPADFIEGVGRYLPVVENVIPVHPTKAGTVHAIDTRAVGLAIVEMGGGRLRSTDPIDHAVGLSELAPIGAEVDDQRPLAVIHARSKEQATRAAERVCAAYTLSESVPKLQPLVIKRIHPNSASREDM